MGFLIWVLAWQPTATFTAADVRADLDFMLSAMEQAHPNLYHSTSREKLHALASSVVVELDDSVDLAEAYRAIARVTAAVGEGHTGTASPEAMKTAYDKALVFPVGCKAVDETGLVVDDDRYVDQGLQPGDRIVSINGQSSVELFNTAMSLQGGSEGFRRALTLQRWPRWLFNLDVRAPFRLKVARGDQTHTVELPGLPPEQAAPPRKNNASEPYRYEVRQDKIVYLDFRSMDDAAAFETFAKNMFSDPDVQQAKGLIVDLRANSGGHSALGVTLLRYLTDKPFRMAGGVTWKVSEPYRAFLQKEEKRMRDIFGGGYDYYMLQKVGSIIRNDAGPPQAPPMEPLRFSEPVCFLIGPLTFSSANMLANAVEDYDLATLIGEPSGAPSNEFGELCMIDLPNTGIRVYTSTKQFIRANGDAADMSPVQPDILVRQTEVDTAAGIDSALARAVTWIDAQP